MVFKIHWTCILVSSKVWRNYRSTANLFCHAITLKRSDTKLRNATHFPLNMNWDHDDVIKLKHLPVTGPLCVRFTGEFPAQRPVTRSFDIFFDLRPNNRLSEQSRGWGFETPSWPFWRHCNRKHAYRHGPLGITWQVIALCVGVKLHCGSWCIDYHALMSLVWR